MLDKIGSIAVAYDEDISEGGAGGNGTYSGYTYWTEPQFGDSPYKIMTVQQKRLVIYNAAKPVQTCFDRMVYTYDGYSFCCY